MLKSVLAAVFLFFAIEVLHAEEGEFKCEPPDGIAAELKCPQDNYLLNALASRSPFFGDALSPSCNAFKDKLVSDEETEHVFFSPDNGLSISAQCSGEDYVIYKYTLCVIDGHIPVVVIRCRQILNKDLILGSFNATSDEKKHVFVECGPKTVLQKIFMMDSGDGIVTRVVFQCLELDAEEMDDTDVEGL